MTSLAGELADFVVQTRWEDIPRPVQEASQNLLVDSIACAIAGRHAAARADFAKAARGLGDGKALVISDTQPAGRAAASMINSWQATAITMCDVFRPRMCHVSPPLLGAGLAEWHEDATVEDLLRAVALGAEVTVRLCESLEEELYRGARWHAPGVVGPFGAATTAAALGGFEADDLERCWGLALLQSAGTFASIGSPGVKFTQARAALAGIAAVDMTRVGLGGQLDPLEHPDGGLFVAYGGKDPDLTLRHLGQDWRLLGISLRGWPAASSLQAVVEGVRALRAEVGDGTDPSRMIVELPSQSYALCADKGWLDQLTALQSARWIAASVWRTGNCLLESFLPAALADPATGELARHIRIVASPGLGDGASRVRLGDTEVEIPLALGTPTRPLSARDIEEKLVGAAGEQRAHRLLAAIENRDSHALRSSLIA